MKEKNHMIIITDSELCFLFFFLQNSTPFYFIFHFTILYWFCHTLTWIHHGCTCVPHPEPPSHLPPHPIPQGHSSASTPSTLYHASNLDWRIQFIYDNIHVSVPFSQIIPSSPSPTESKRLFYTSVSLLLSHILDYHYHLSKFHIYAFSSVQSLSRVWLFATPWIAARRPPCPSPTPGVHSDSCPSSRWCIPAISSSVVPFSSCPQSLPASESFPTSQLFAWGGQT